MVDGQRGDCECPSCSFLQSRRTNNGERSDQVKGFSVFIFGYNCQQNAFATQHNELLDATSDRALAVATLAVGGSTAVYFAVSISGYFVFGPGVDANVLDSFASDGSAVVGAARVGIVGVVLLSYPVVMHAAVQSAENLLFGTAQVTITRHNRVKLSWQ